MPTIRLPAFTLLLAVTTVAPAADPPDAKTSEERKPVSGRIEESIHVEVVGRLRTGIFAIGGETTGTTITAKGITWELDFGKNAKLTKVAESLDGKSVRVEGTLERRRGVEIRERWIVTVSGLEATAAGEKKQSAVPGTLVIPAEVPGFEDHGLEIKLFEFDPRLADVSATLIDEFNLAEFDHAAGKKTEIAFGLGADFEPREDRSYYITVFVTKDGKRTHIGEKDGKRGLAKVLATGQPGDLRMVVRGVR